MTLTVERFAASHAEPAARLVRDRLAALRRQTPELTESCGSPEALAERLARLAGCGPGAVAFDSGKLVGFLATMPIGSFGGRPSMLSPEWGNGTAPGLEPDAAQRIRASVYADVAREWDARGVETHLLCLLAHDEEAFETFSWFGFGRVVCDAVRSLDPVTSQGAPYGVRRAGPGDADLLFGFDRHLHAHMESSPIFLSHGEPEGPEWWAARVADRDVAAWIAADGAGPVGYLIQGRATDDACDLIVDPATSSITGAYVVPEARGGGASTALLSRAVEWAREQGYARLSVDFETANVAAARFWLRHFRPVVVSFARTVQASRNPRQAEA